MIVIGNKKTYCFEGMHLPRIYINNEKKVRASLDVLQRNGSLTNKEMAEETQRVRSEDIREILYLLWRLGFGIDVSKKGREITFLANDKLQGILELEDKELKELILTRLKVYNPFIAILDNLIGYRGKSQKFTERDITRDFHNNRCDGGRIDNTHPLLRWSKDTNWNLVSDKEITDIGIKYVNECKEIGVFYFHHTVDLKASDKLNIIAHILSDASFEEKEEKISYGDILGLLENVSDFELDKKELEKTLKELIKIGLPIKLNNDEVLIKNKIYHDITPQYYVKFKIHLIDGIDELEIEEGGELKKVDKDKLIKEFSNIAHLVITDEKKEKSNYPNKSGFVSYKEFISISAYLPLLKIQSIILPNGWKPLKVTKISGILLSFVRLGGNVLIFHAPMGRIGSNRNLFNWLPQDLARISFVHSNSSDNIEGYFSFPLGEEFLFTKKENYIETEKDSKKYLILFTKYNKGFFVFVGFNESKDLFNRYIAPLKNKLVIDPNSKDWTYRYIPSINRMRGVNTEFDLYPLLREVMSKNFEFEFDPEITGKSGQTDLFIEKPFFCCCEITPPNSNATGFSKVSEVEGHRRTMVFKDVKKDKKRFGNDKVGACVIGPSFTIEAGEDKAGAVDMANAMGVSLISYRDLYELICLSDKCELTQTDLKKIFFNDGEKSEASIKIYELINEKNINKE